MKEQKEIKGFWIRLKKWLDEPAIEYKHTNRWQGSKSKLVYSKTSLKLFGRKIF